MFGLIGDLMMKVRQKRMPMPMLQLSIDLYSVQLTLMVVEVIRNECLLSVIVHVVHSC